MKVSGESLRAYLLAREWQIRPIEGGVRLVPPSYLRLPPDFFVVLPANDSMAGATTVVEAVTTSVAEIYGLSRDSLSSALNSGEEILSIRLASPNFSDGSMPLGQFEAVVERIRRALLNTAAFIVSESHTIETIPQEAKDYLAGCRFLQTEQGSFVARIRLPAAASLVEPTLFEASPLTTDDVNERFTDIVRFVVHEVLPAEARPTEGDVFESSLDLINIDVLKEIRELLARSGAATIDFGFTASRDGEILSTGHLSQFKIERLDSFIAFASERLAGDEEIDVVGRIVELRSRRPDRRRNHVLVSCVVGGKEVLVGVSMGRRDYPTATTVHHKNGLVRVKGLARQLKTQLRITKLLIFEEIQ